MIDESIIKLFADGLVSRDIEMIREAVQLAEDRIDECACSSLGLNECVCGAWEDEQD